MEAKLLASTHPLHSSFYFNRRPSSLRIQPILIDTPINLRLTTLHAAGPAANSTEETNNNDETKAEATPTAPTQPKPQINTLNIRYRARSKRQAKKQQEQQTVEAAQPPKKDWESMTLAEKALELYVGEKGLLFWLNKFAYASIFIIIGGWILFRFVGPYLGLYQLDAPPLSPTSILKGST